MTPKSLILPFLLLSFLAIGQRDFRYILENTNTAFLDSLSHVWELKMKAEKELAIEKARQMGWPITQTFPDGQYIELQRLDENGEPVYITTFNTMSAATSRTDRVHSGGGAGLDLEGNGMIIGQWDVGKVRSTHEQLEGRVVNIDSNVISDFQWHSTLVAGTLIADGTGTGSNAPNAKGMAPQATLHAYSISNDLARMATAAADGLLVSNHSYGNYGGWSWNGSLWVWQGGADQFNAGGEEPRFGKYFIQTKNRDIVAENAPYYLIFQAAGNDRGNNPNPSQPVYDPILGDTVFYDPAIHPGGDGGFDCLTLNGSAKNTMVVGAVNDVPDYTGPASVAMSGFSGWGPTDDGRIKPDIVANGVGMFSTGYNADDAYSSGSGTSLSSPSAAGPAILLQEHYRNIHGSGIYMRSSTLRGLIIHTTLEAGDAPGPDYAFGWGLMNTEAAAMVITQDGSDNEVIQEQTLNGFDVYTVQVISDGTQPLKATLCWIDPAGEVSAYDVVDDPHIKLVNDLDMEMTNDSNLYLPYILDPANPAGPAGTGDNDRDNVEQIYVPDPDAGTYTIAVKHEGSLQGGNQAFSLIITGGEVEPYTSPPVQPECSHLIVPTNGSTQVPVSTGLTWTAAGGPILGYQLKVGTIPGGTDILDNLDVGNMTHYTFPGSLPVNATIYVSITPYTANGDIPDCAQQRFFTDGCPEGNVVFVKSDATGNDDGSSWTHAFTNLKDAINMAVTCPNTTEIWVAAGTYYPTRSTDRSVSFQLQNGIAIYGGFNGTETLRSERNWGVNETILSGDIGTSGDFFDNSYHIVYNRQGQDSTALLDGFIIAGGNASDSNNYPQNAGGGMLNENGSSPVIANCRFVANSAFHGGGMYNINLSSPSLTNCVFSGNASNSGGGMYNENASPVLLHCSFSGNGVDWEDGGGMYNENASPTVTNCIFWGNGGHEIAGDTTSNPVVTYCLVERGYPGTGNISEGPFFISQPSFTEAPTMSGDLHIQDCSPAIDAGTPVAGMSLFDYDGDMRPEGAGFDMGFDENGSGNGISCCPPGQVLYVDSLATGQNDGTSWSDAFTSLQDALLWGNNCLNIQEVWVAKGTYFPTSGDDRKASFILKNNLSIYGGFAGGEMSLIQRNWNVNETILSGDIGLPGDSTDNSIHVVSGLNRLDGTAVLDGCTIAYGNAAVGYNLGGGMYNIASSPALVNCRFIGNSGLLGGGVYIVGISSTTFVNCSFIGNKATVGAGIYFGANDSTSLTLTNCSFLGNKAEGSGAGIGALGNGLTSILTNCSFSGNLTENGGPGVFLSGNASLTNCILWGNGLELIPGGNLVVSHSIIEGGFPGTGNLDTDPLFVDQPPIGLGVAGDLRLRACSPAVDAGDNAANNTLQDLAGNDRIFDATGTGTPVIDIGAYEYPAPGGPVIQTVDSLMIAPGNLVNGIPVFSDTTFMEQFVTQEGCDSISTTYVTLLTAARETLRSQLGFRVYPNPAGELFYLEFEPEQPVELSVLITDGIGREVVFAAPEQVWKPGRQRMSVNAAGWGAGVYFVYVRTDVGWFVERVVVE